eukprot:6946259-Prymnesium_polylepis.1
MVDGLVRVMLSWPPAEPPCRGMRVSRCPANLQTNPFWVLRSGGRRRARAANAGAGRAPPPAGLPPKASMAYGLTPHNLSTPPTRQQRESRRGPRDPSLPRQLRRYNSRRFRAVAPPAAGRAPRGPVNGPEPKT